MWKTQADSVVWSLQMRSRWRRKRLYMSVHQWRTKFTEERCLRQSERILQTWTRSGILQSSFLQWRTKLLESRSEQRGERAGELYWMRRRREAFLRWKGNCAAAFRMEPSLASSPPERSMSPLVVSPREAGAMRFEDRGRVGALESALQRTEAERSAAVSRVKVLESHLSECVPREPAL